MEVVLSGYWKDVGMDPVLKAAVLADWADELEDWSVEQVIWALREWRRNNTGRPHQGDILRILKRERGRAEARRMADATPAAAAPGVVVTEDARARNLAVMQKLFPTLVKRMPEVRADG